MLASERTQSKHNVLVHRAGSHRKVITKSHYIKDNKDKKYRSLHNHKRLIYRSIKNVKQRMAPKDVGGKGSASHGYSGN